MPELWPLHSSPAFLAFVSRSVALFSRDPLDEGVWADASAAAEITAYLPHKRVILALRAFDFGIAFQKASATVLHHTEAIKWLDFSIKILEKADSFDPEIQKRWDGNHFWPIRFFNRLKVGLYFHQDITCARFFVYRSRGTRESAQVRAFSA